MTSKPEIIHQEKPGGETGWIVYESAPKRKFNSIVPDSQQELQGAHISPELATNGPEPLFVISPKPVLDHEWHIYEKTTDQPNVGSLAYV